jgi:hypothetical protein
VAALPEKDSTLRAVTDASPGLFDTKPSIHGAWTLIATAGSTDGEVDDEMRGTLIQLKSAAVQFGHAGLQVELQCDQKTSMLAKDWRLPEDGILIREQPSNNVKGFSLSLVSPDGTAVRTWQGYLGPVELGMALRQNVGLPDFAFLPFETVRATD